MTAGTPHATAERAAREAYGRLVAILSARSRDVAAAEDALSVAFRRALETWPASGVPDRPEAWLLTVARRELGHDARHRRVQEAALPDLVALTADDAETTDAIPDERLRLLFVCAHPAIDAAVQAPLMLQTVLGLDAERIAASFLTSPTAMGQRLVRAKAKIRDAGLRFEVPDRVEWDERLEAVLAAVYAAFGTGWEDVLGADPRRKGLAEEAIWLGRVLAELLPETPEVQGLLALMLYCHARRAARRDAEGRFVPLQAQDTALWDRDALREAERRLTRAAAAGTLGRFQLEAAIQSVHSARAVTGRIEWGALVTLYGLLADVAPTVGVRVAAAAVLAEAGEADTAHARLVAMADEAQGYQPYWAALGRVETCLGRPEAAARAYRQAAGMTEDPGVRQFLLAQVTTTGG